MRKNYQRAQRAAACSVITALRTAAAGPPDDSGPTPVPDGTNAPASAVTQSSAARVGAEGGQSWNFHAQNTDTVQYQPSFPAAYAGPNSLLNADEARETVSIDLVAGARLWRGAEFHLDGLLWQGYGLSKTLGLEAFPNAEAYRVGVTIPNANIARAFLRQTFGLGGESETVPDDALHLAGRRDVSNVTVTLGRMSAHDIFDLNRYANDPRLQFMNWGMTANLAWDYPADSLGYMTGLALELNQPQWAVRYGFFQMPREPNGLALDPRFLEAWGMVNEWERRWSLDGRPGALRFLAYLNSAHMGSYQEALNDEASGLDLAATRAYRYRFGFGLNGEQELADGIGVFARLGRADGRTQAWVYTDVDETASAGISFSGKNWDRPGDTIGLAGIVSGISKVHQEFLEAGGTGILAGDGALDYGLEKLTEVYYDLRICRNLQAALDYQFAANPAFNKARGPVSVFGARIHWEF